VRAYLEHVRAEEGGDSDSSGALLLAANRVAACCKLLLGLVAHCCDTRCLLIPIAHCCLLQTRAMVRKHPPNHRSSARIPPQPRVRRQPRSKNQLQPTPAKPRSARLTPPWTAVTMRPPHLEQSTRPTPPRTAVTTRPPHLEQSSRRRLPLRQSEQYTRARRWSCQLRLPAQTALRSRG
jgi:hypothetical protein